MIDVGVLAFSNLARYRWRKDGFACFFAFRETPTVETTVRPNW